MCSSCRGISNYKQRFKLYYLHYDDKSLEQFCGWFSMLSFVSLSDQLQHHRCSVTHPFPFCLKYHQCIYTTCFSTFRFLSKILLLLSLKLRILFSCSYFCLFQLLLEGAQTCICLYIGILNRGGTIRQVAKQTPPFNLFIQTTLVENKWKKGWKMIPQSLL